MLRRFIIFSTVLFFLSLAFVYSIRSIIHYPEVSQKIDIRHQLEYVKTIKDYNLILKLREEGYQVKDDEKTRKIIDQINDYEKYFVEVLFYLPEVPAAQFDYGSFLVDTGRTEEAFEHFKIACARNYRFYQAYFALAEIERQRGDLEQSLYYLRKYSLVNKGVMPAYVDLLFELIRLIKEFPEEEAYRTMAVDMMKQYTQQLSENPTSVDSLIDLGRIYFEFENVDRAVSALQLALSMESKNAEALYQMGLIAVSQGQLDRATALFENSLRSDKTKSEAYSQLGDISMLRKNFQDAERRYFQAVKYNKSDSEVYFKIGFLMETTGNKEEAVKYYLKAIEFNPLDAEYYFNLGNIYMSENELNLAKEAYLNAIEFKDNHINAWVNLSILSTKMKNFKAASIYLEQAVILGYDAPKDFVESLAPYKK